MRTRMSCVLIMLLWGLTGSAIAGSPGILGTEGPPNTIYGSGAGAGPPSSGYNTFIGVNAGHSNTTAGNNTFVGESAGYNATEGQENTFVGSWAGYQNTSGYYNTLVGLGAGYNNTNGYENTFIGHSAGYSNTGNYNTFLGKDAGRSNTSADRNTFVGYGTGYSNFTGTRNTFLGYSAGYNNKGGFNTFVGDEAGYTNSTGVSNTFLGSSAGSLNSTGGANTFLGVLAGYFLQTGSFNTFVGSEAGYRSETGVSNTFLGKDAGHENKEGAGNVFIGYQAGYNEKGSDRLYIDNSTTSSPLIYGEFDNDIVRINGRLGVLKSPGASYQLDVGGAVNATSFVGDGSGLTNLSEVDPKVGTLTAGRWCTSNGTTVSCTQTPPITAEVDPKVGTLTAGRWCTSNGTTVNCTQTAPLTAEVDPKVGSLTAGRWCTSNGSTVSCTQTAPLTAEVDPKVGSNTLNCVPRWDGSSLVTGSLYDDGTDVTVSANLNVVAPDNGLIHLTNTLTDNATKVSRMVLNHYSNAQLPLYLFGAASTATNNFVAFGGGNTMGNAATQLDLFTAPNTTTPIGIARLTIKGNGYVGIGTQTPSQPLHMASGAHVTAGGVWMNASSREYKENIKELKADDASQALMKLNPVSFNYKTSPVENHVGFIAEEVPDLVATKDRKGLSPMDIVAVLAKVVQEQQKVVQEQQKMVQNQQESLKELKAKNEKLEQRLLVLEGKGIGGK